MWVGGRAVGRFGWRPFFLMLGLAGLLWLPLWSGWMPRRTDAPSRAQRSMSGYLDIIVRRSAWGTCIGQASINYFLYFLVTWLPSYLQRGRHLSLHDVANAGGLLFPGFRSFLGSHRTGCGPLDPRGSFSDAGTQRPDAVRPPRNWRLSRHHGAGVRQLFHGDAHFNRWHRTRPRRRSKFPNQHPASPASAPAPGGIALRTLAATGSAPDSTPASGRPYPTAVAEFKIFAPCDATINAPRGATAGVMLLGRGWLPRWWAGCSMRPTRQPISGSCALFKRFTPRCSFASRRSLGPLIRF